MWENYVSIYPSYELTAMNNVTRNSGIFTLHIIGICPYTNMPNKPHLYVLLYIQYSLNLDPILL